MTIKYYFIMVICDPNRTNLSLSLIFFGGGEGGGVGGSFYHFPYTLMKIETYRHIKYH